MKLETVAKQYGMLADYYDMHTGRIYKLPDAIDNGDGTLSVPVIEGGQLIGHARMDKVTE